MTIDFNHFVLFQIVVDLGFIGAAVWCIPKMRGYRRMVQIMTAESPAVPTDRKLIEEWAKKYGSLPKGSPKWTAYKNRLEEVGYFDTD